MLIEGHAAASLDVELAGEYEGLSLVAHFAPYNGKSIFYAQGLSLGVKMYYDIAVWTDNGWEWFRQFTGVVREIELSRERGIVIFLWTKLHSSTWLLDRVGSVLAQSAGITLMKPSGTTEPRHGG